MNLLIAAYLSDVSESFAFRRVTSVVRQDYRLPVLILSERELIDLYFIYLRARGLFDYIDAILSIEEKQEKGIKLEDSKEANIRVKGIFLNNQFSILDKIEKIKNFT